MPEEHSPAIKPADFFLGVVDVFAIVLPGALLAWVMYAWLSFDPARARLLRPLPTEGIQAWACFLIVSYIFGHALHFLGGFVFDPFYDGVYKNWKRSGMRDDARSRFRARIAAHARYGANFREHDNILTWSLAWLRLSAPAAIAELDRLEADSKFFRSLATALIISWPMVFAWFARNDSAVGLVWLELLVLPALWTFARHGKYEGGSLRSRIRVIMEATRQDRIPAPPPRPRGTWQWLWDRLTKRVPLAFHQERHSPLQAADEDLYVYAEALATSETVGHFLWPAIFLFVLWIAFIGFCVWRWSDMDGMVASVVLILLIMFAVLRYMKLRLERTSKAYEFFVAEPSIVSRASATAE